MQTVNLSNKRKETFIAILFLLFVMNHFSLHAQVIIGTTEELPKAGTLLDLNSMNGTKGGLLLSNVPIDHLELIPTGTDVFPGIDETNNATNMGLRGAMVYNPGTATVPRGIYVWNGRSWTPDGTPAPERILFTVRITDADRTYILPTRGYVSNEAHTYDWDISIDGAKPEHHTGTSSSSAGINLTFATAGDHQMEITPHNAPEPGWGNAFGHYAKDVSANTNITANSEKLVSIDAPLTTMAFAPNADNTSAAYMFASLFEGCTNLTAPATFLDTYKLPDTVTDLSGFLFRLHRWNSSLTTPVDLTPLSGWFNANTSITNLSNFLSDMHVYNSLTTPVDFTPLSGWFNANTSINNLSNFLSYTYYNCSNLTTPIDLTPLSGWFDTGTSMSNLHNFLYSTHCSNTSLKLEGQKIFPNWIKTLKQGTTPIQDVTDTFYRTFYHDSSLSGDTKEPVFEDGTVLSSIGDPNTARDTYTNRTGITPQNNTNNYWK